MWEAVEATALALHLRASLYTYPLVNAGHIIGIALLFGSIVPLDLRLLGFWQSVPVEVLLRVCRRMAACGFALAVSMGLLLFITRATEYAADPIFQAKQALIVLAAANAALAPRMFQPNKKGRMRVHAGLSLLLWLAVILAGRAIAYF